MGFLTTVTIYNDSVDELMEHPKELAEKLYSACCDIRNRHKYDGFSSSLILQKPRHADNHTLYLHAGNTVTDVYDAKNEWAIETYIKEMQYHLKRLKKLKKEMNDEKNNI